MCTFCVSCASSLRYAPTTSTSCVPCTLSATFCSSSTAFYLKPARTHTASLSLALSLFCIRYLYFRCCSVQICLLQLLSRVGSHHLPVADLQKYLVMLRSPSFPVNVLDTLVHISRRKNVPTYYADFSKEYVHAHSALMYSHLVSHSCSSLSVIDLPSLGDRPFPPPRGLGVAFWLHISNPLTTSSQPTASNAPTTEHLPAEMCVFSLDGGVKSFKLDVLYKPRSFNGSGHLRMEISASALSSSGSAALPYSPAAGITDAVAFTEFTFQPGRWYHVAVSFAHSSVVRTPLPAKVTPSRKTLTRLPLLLLSLRCICV